MTKSAFEKIKAGLEDALAYAEGDTARGKATVVAVEACDVAAIRARLNLSQARFASALAVPVSTLRKWEQGQRVPSGPARALLKVMEREPEAVRRALAG